jgi:hypothetical protein
VSASIGPFVRVKGPLSRMTRARVVIAGPVLAATSVRPTISGARHLRSIGACWGVSSAGVGGGQALRR